MSENIIHILPEMVASLIAVGEVVQRPFSVNDAIGETPNSYSMIMEYNKMSSPVVFNQSITTDKGTTFKNNTYLYNQNSQPNAPIQIGDMHYSYDAAGNPTSILDASGIGRDMVWDAENRLKEIIDNKEGLFHSYAYDHTGERILKRYGTAQSGYVNGKDMGTLYDFGESYSAYVSPYFVESNNGYTKHYYAGATRLVSKIGESVYENESYISYGDKEKDQYFYYQDHLGSSTYITDLNREIAQYSAYTPYGEIFREYRNVTPYRFNGKELDTETGLYYYGARYYNPNTALWLGVDPLTSKYPGVSPYVYCVSNPVKYVDPDGRRALPLFENYNNWNVKVDSWYGKRNIDFGSKFHKGIDFNYSCGGNNDLGTPILSTHDGVASIKNTNSNSSGRMITITTSDGKYRTRYMHLSEISIKEGEYITEGSIIGLMGGSGKGQELGYTSHLHYEIQQFSDGEWHNINPSETNNINHFIDPQTLINKEEQTKYITNINLNNKPIHNTSPKHKNREKNFSLYDAWVNFTNKIESLYNSNFY